MSLASELNQKRARQGRLAGLGDFLPPDPQDETAREVANTIQRAEHSDLSLKEMKRVGELARALSPEQRERLGLPAEDKTRGVFEQLTSAVGDIPGVHTVMNVLDRASQATQQTLMNARSNAGTRETFGEFFNALQGDYGVGGKHADERMSLSKIIRNDEDHVSSGWLDGITDFVGDVALDPLTYLSFGTSAAAKSGLRGLAQAGAGDLAQQIERQGLRRTLAEGAVEGGEQGIRDILARQAAAGGVSDVERAVNRQMRGLSGSARGGARLRLPGMETGITLPGSTRLHRSIFEAQPSGRLSSGLRSIGLGGVSDALDAGRAARRNLFTAPSHTLTNLGEDTAQRLSQVQHGTFSTAEELASKVDTGLLELSGEVGPRELGNARLAFTGDPEDLLGLTPGGSALADRVLDLTVPLQQAADDVGFRVDVPGKVQAKINSGMNPAEAIRAVTAEVAPAVSRTELAQKLADFRGGRGERLGFIKPTKKQIADHDLVKLDKRFSELYVPRSIQKDTSAYISRITNDEGVMLVNDAMEKAMRAWKSSATVLPVSSSFFANNLLGNIALMVGAGFKNVNTIPDGVKIAMALRGGGKGIDNLSPQLRSIVDRASEHGIITSTQIRREVTQTADQAARFAAGKQSGRLRKAAAGVTGTGTAVNQFLEDASRIALFEDGLRQGMSVSEAAMRVDQALFNYADLSKFETQAKKLIPFYTFMRKNLGVQGRLMASAPGVISGQIHLSDAVATALSSDEDGIFPDWAVAAGYIPGVGNTLMRPRLPINDAMDQIAPFVAGVPGLGNGTTGEDIARSLLQPIGGPAAGAGKAAVEYATGQKLFSGAPIGTGLEGPLVSNLLPPAGRTRSTTNNLTKLAGGDLTGLLGLVGASSVDLGNEEMQNAIIQSRLREVQDILSEMGAPTLQELQSVGLAERLPTRSLADYTEEEIEAAIKARAERQDMLMELARRSG